MHLRYDVDGTDEAGEYEYPRLVMSHLGINYQDVICSSVGRYYIFWNCTNVGEIEKLPTYITCEDLDPMRWIGYGLSQERAERIQELESCG